MLTRLYCFSVSLIILFHVLFSSTRASSFPKAACIRSPISEIYTPTNQFLYTDHPFRDKYHLLQELNSQPQHVKNTKLRGKIEDSFDPLYTTHLLRCILVVMIWSFSEAAPAATKADLAGISSWAQVAAISWAPSVDLAVLLVVTYVRLRRPQIPYHSRMLQRQNFGNLRPGGTRKGLGWYVK